MKLAGYVTIDNRTFRWQCMETVVRATVRLTSTDGGEILETDLTVDSLEALPEAVYSQAIRTERAWREGMS